MAIGHIAHWRIHKKPAPAFKAGAGDTPLFILLQYLMVVSSKTCSDIRSPVRRNSGYIRPHCLQSPDRMFPSGAWSRGKRGHSLTFNNWQNGIGVRRGNPLARPSRLIVSNGIYHVTSRTMKGMIFFEIRMTGQNVLNYLQGFQDDVASIY